MSTCMNLNVKLIGQRKAHHALPPMPTHAPSSGAKSLEGNPEQFIVSRRRSSTGLSKALMQSRTNSARPHCKNSQHEFTRPVYPLDVTGDSRRDSSKQAKMEPRGPELPGESKPFRLSAALSARGQRTLVQLPDAAQHQGRSVAEMGDNRKAADFIDVDQLGELARKSNTFEEGLFDMHINEKPSRQFSADSASTRASTLDSSPKKMDSFSRHSASFERSGVKSEEVHLRGALPSRRKSSDDLDAEFNNLLGQKNPEWDPEVGLAPEEVLVRGTERLQKKRVEEFNWSATVYVDAFARAKQGFI